VNPREERFTALAHDLGPRVLGYAARRIDPPEEAADVLAETLLVTWRRLDSVPSNHSEALPWMLGVARRCLANRRRSRRRRNLLVERLRAHLAATVPAHEPDPLAREIRVALAQLPEVEREMITLVAWEELSPAEAARVLGIRQATARKRLQRGRDRLKALLSEHFGLAAPAGGEPALHAVDFSA
jgi:RNA polymerase sigma-70 factor, ECF subfamily